MKTVRAALATFLLLFGLTAPASADFEYTETSQVTGGALVKMMKTASVFARGDTKKQEQQALQPNVTTHYVKGNRLRTDNTDGTAQIIDLDGRRVISIDTTKMTYAVATFDQIHDAMQQAMQNAQQAQQAPQDPAAKNVQLTPEIHVTPGAGSRVILDQPTNESKIEMDLTMQATGTGAAAPLPGQPNSATMTMNMDTFVAPGVAGYLEFGQFYRRMAQEVNWMTLPSNVQVSDPRVTQGLSSLRENSDALKGFPLLSYVNMSMAVAGQPDGSQTTAQTTAQTSGGNSSSAQPANSSSNNSIPDSPSAAVVKGLGGLFGKKKQKNQDSANQGNANQGDASQTQAAPPPNSSSDSNDFIEITTQVTKFSDSSLDGSLFDVPAGYAQIQVDPGQILAGRSAQRQPAPAK